MGWAMDVRQTLTKLADTAHPVASGANRVAQYEKQQ